MALGAARGLAFLHNAQPQVIYRDFKASNILLDSVWHMIDTFCSFGFGCSQRSLSLTVSLYLQNYNAKLSDFGLARDGPMGDNSHVSTRIMGTQGYAAPEYLATGIYEHAFSLIMINEENSNTDVYVNFERSFIGEERCVQFWGCVTGVVIRKTSN